VQPTPLRRRRNTNNASARKAEVELALARSGGTWQPPVATTFAEYAEHWLGTYAATAVKPRVLVGYRKAVEEFAALHGERKLAALSRSDVKAYVGAKLAESASGTVRNRLVPVRELLAHAVEDGLIPANPAAGIRIPQSRARKIVPPSRADVEKLIEHARPEAQPVFVVAAVCGLRRGELFALRWVDVDFESGMLHVHASNYATTISDTKTEAGERYVPLFESARKALAEAKLRSRFAQPQDFVFATVVGTPLDPGNFVRREFKPALTRANLDAFRFHDLRHFAVSALIAAGADIKLLQAIAGHASATMTLEVYGHLMTARVQEAALRYDPLAERGHCERYEPRRPGSPDTRVCAGAPRHGGAITRGH
jgi:integrase